MVAEAAWAFSPGILLIEQILGWISCGGSFVKRQQVA
jgi:hypothetical protein